MAEKNKNDDNVEVKQKKSTGKIIIIIIDVTTGKSPL